MLIPYLRKLDTTGKWLAVGYLPYLVKYTDTAAFLSAYYNKTVIDSKLALKLNISDTAAMLSPYARTANLPSLAPYVKYTDTSTMLSPYYRTANATAALALKLNISDTATMLSSYYNKTTVDSKVNLKVNISDTLSMLSPYQRSFLAVKYTDTASMLSNYRTNINSLISDSVYQAAQILLRVRYTDTSTMLSPYARTLSLGGYVPYSGATNDLNIGTHNLYANNFFDGFTNIAASGTQIVLTTASTPSYTITGSGGQTIKLPDATTLPNGAIFYFNNNQTTGAITINNNSNTLIISIPSGGFAEVYLLDNSIAAGSWDRHFQAPSNVSWSTNTFDYPGSITSATWNGNTIAINRGGTGASTSGGALTNLGAQPQLNGTGFVKASGTTISYDNSTYLTSADIAGKVNYSDTASMLSPYYRTATATAALATKVNIADTSAMLSAYYNKTAVDAKQALNVKYTDTASMLSGYYRSSNPSGYITSSAISGKVNYTDTSSMLSPYLRSLNASATYLTQTNAASTYYLQTNPAGYITSSAISGKVNYTDTATMLSAYYNKTAANALLATKEPTISAGTTAQYWRGDKSWQTLNTTAVAEGTNLYFTNARAQGAITLTTTGSSGSATYTGGTLNVPTYTLAGLGGQPQLNGTGFVKATGTTISYDNSTYLSTGSASATYVPYAGAVGSVNLNTYSFTANKMYGTYTTNLRNYNTVNPSTNVSLMSSPNTVDSWIFLDQADASSNWGIYHRQIDSALGTLEANSIAFVGGGNSSLKAFVGLNTGNGYFSGGVTATSFSGSGSGLTGTASGLSIGGNAATVTNGLTTTNYSSYALPLSGGILTGTETINTDNGYLILNRSATNKYIGIDYKTSNSEKWFAGLRETGTDNYIIYNANTISDVFTLNVTNNAATFSSSVTIAGTNDGYGTLYVSALASTNAARLRNSSASFATLDINNADASGIGVYSVASKNYFSGNVAIGTNNPDAQLVINGSSNSRFNMRAGDTRYGTIYADAGIFAVASITSIPLIFGVNDVEKMRITSGGNVYVGAITGTYSSYGYVFGVRATGGTQTFMSITAPGETLDDHGLAIGVDANAGSFYMRDAKYMNFFTTNTERMRITSGGNLLVGTTTDNGYKLNVNGNGYFSSNIKIVPTSESWGEGLSFYMPTTGQWGGLRWQRNRSGSDGNWGIGFTALDYTDDLVFSGNNSGTQVDNIIRLQKAGYVLMGTATNDGSGAKLQVAGDIHATGNLVVSGTTFGGVTTQAYGYGHIYKGYTGSAYDVMFINPGNAVDELQVIGGLNMTTTTAGFTVPNMTTTQKNALTKRKGMIVYDTTANLLQAWNGASWNNLW